jgi:hypothetical protein
VSPSPHSSLHPSRRSLVVSPCTLSRSPYSLVKYSTLTTVVWIYSLVYVFVAAHTVSFLVCALSPNIGVFLFGRVVCGVSGSVSSTMVRIHPGINWVRQLIPFPAGRRHSCRYVAHQGVSWRFFVRVGLFLLMRGNLASRGAPMSLFAFTGLFGLSLGPVAFGFAAQELSWRWIQWITVCSPSHAHFLFQADGRVRSR